MLTGTILRSDDHGGHQLPRHRFYTFSTGAIFTTEGLGIAEPRQRLRSAHLRPDGGIPRCLRWHGRDLCVPGLYRSQQQQHLRQCGRRNLQFPPDNDTPETAQAIACDLILPVPRERQRDEYNGTSVLGNSISNNGAIWYEFNADQDYQVTFNTCASADVDNGVTDTDVIVFVENTDGSLTPIATNDDSGVPGCGAGTTGTWNSIVSINAEQGMNYFVRVGTFSSTTTQTGIVIEANCAVCPDGFPNNDDLCTLALPLVDGGSYTGSLCSAVRTRTSASVPEHVCHDLRCVVPGGNRHHVQPVQHHRGRHGHGSVGYAIYSGADCTDLSDLSEVWSGLVRKR